MTEPSPERRQHDRITRAPEQVADADGAIGSPWRAEGLLARLERHGDIGHRERAAGDEFGRLFQLAHLDPLRAADMSTPLQRPGTPALSGANARAEIHRALDSLGGLHSPAGCAAWFVLGCELSLRQWALREGWAGRPLREPVAKGILLAALGTLARHFRT